MKASEFVVILPALLVCCGPQSKTSLDSANSSSSLGVQLEDIGKRLDEMERRLSSVDIDISILKVKPYLTATFDPTTKEGYSRLDTNVGTFLIAVQDVQPYLDGVKVRLEIGNIQSTTFNGFAVNGKYGLRYPRFPQNNPEKSSEERRRDLDAWRASNEAHAHHAALPYASMNAFWEALAGQSGVAAAALRFTILTAARTNETIGATWAEIDLEKAEWTIPGARMKSGRDHRVPLSAAALAILRTQYAATEGKGFVFPGAKKGKPLSNMAMMETLRRMKRHDLTVHGFRSTFRDWAAEMTNYAGEVAEAALAHAVGDKVEAAYRRGDLFEKRRNLMDAWATFCLSPAHTATVTPIRAVG